jgi:hypothetical protein
MSYTGVNTKCAQCVKTCKQFKNVTVVRCNFIPIVSNLKGAGGLQAGKTRLNRD